MPLLNPVYAFIVPFLFVVTVPLAVFAGLTTTVAFSVLMLRVLAAYIDVALSLLPQYLSIGRRQPRPYRPVPPPPPQLQRFASPVPTATSGTTALSSSSNSPPSATPTPLRRRRRRRSSSALSATSLTPAASETALGLMPSIGPERDFEGVGGWRLGNDDDDDKDVVDVWTTLNSRLELPDKQHHHSTRNHHGHLCLSPSGPTTPAEPALYLMMKAETRKRSSASASAASPNSGRTRTPSGPRIAFSGKTLVDSYFPLFKSAPKARKCDV